MQSTLGIKGVNEEQSLMQNYDTLIIIETNYVPLSNENCLICTKIF